MGTKHFCPSHLWFKSIYILKSFQFTIYWEKTQILKIFPSDIRYYKKYIVFFSCELQLITVLLLICDSYMSWSTRFISSLKICLGFSIFDSVLFLPKFIFFVNSKKHILFDFKGASTKNCESVKKQKFVMKMFSQIMQNEVLKSFENWYLLT